MKRPSQDFDVLSSNSIFDVDVDRTTAFDDDPGSCLSSCNPKKYRRLNEAEVLTSPFMPKSFYSAREYDDNALASPFFFPSVSDDIHEKDPSKQADELMAQEMNNMSLEERNEVYHDVHGIWDYVEEHEESRSQKLQEMETEIVSYLQNRKKTRMGLSRTCDYSAYELAEQQSKQFVQDRKRRSMFLRAERFDARKATTRFMKYLEEKLKWFGLEKLTKEISLEDLDEIDMAYFRGGKHQIFPTRDRAGRAIVFYNFDEESQERYIEAQIKIMFYIAEALAEDEETQRKGFVQLVYCADNFDIGLLERKSIWHLCQCTSCTPVRCASMHFCYDNPRIREAVPLFMMAVGSQIRVRSRFHNGSHAKCRFALMTFGIPVHALPIDSEGELKRANHLKWLERRHKQETILNSGGNPSNVGIELPSRYDVLLGRGRPFQDHIGNQRLRYLIEANWGRYASLKKRGEKSALADWILQAIKSSSGRFIQRDDASKRIGWWHEVPDDVAREKVCHAFRSYKVKA